MRRTWVPQLVVSLMLLWALYPGNPYGYYGVLRWVCCGVFAYLAVEAFSRGHRSWVWVLAVTAGVYNPIVPVHMARETWSVINVITIGVAVASVFARSKRDSGS